MKLGDVIVGNGVCPKCEGEMVTKPLKQLDKQGEPQFSKIVILVLLVNMMVRNIKSEMIT